MNQMMVPGHATAKTSRDWSDTGYLNGLPHLHPQSKTAPLTYLAFWCILAFVLTFLWNFSGGGGSWGGTEWKHPWTTYTHVHKCTHTYEPHGRQAKSPAFWAVFKHYCLEIWEKRSEYKRGVWDSFIHSVKGAVSNRKGLKMRIG